MPPHIDLPGASGAAYRFMLVEVDRPLTPGSGLYALLADRSGELAVLETGEVTNLYQDAPVRAQEAARLHGTLFLYVRLHVARAQREAELADIGAALTPAP